MRQLDAVLWSAAEALRLAAVLLAPVHAGFGGEILARLGAPRRRWRELRLDTDGVLAGERPSGHCTQRAAAVAAARSRHGR